MSYFLVNLTLVEQVSNVCKRCINPPGDAIFPNELLLGSQMSDVSRGCLNLSPGGCHILQ